MEEVTGLPATGGRLAGRCRSRPWCELFVTFIDSDRTDRLRVEVEADGAGAWSTQGLRGSGHRLDAQDLVLVIDDITEGKRMEDQLLHTERPGRHRRTRGRRCTRLAIPSPASRASPNLSSRRRTTNRASSPPTS